jgi:hypothetical protein
MFHLDEVMKTGAVTAIKMVMILLFGCSATGPISREDLADSQGNTAVTIVTTSSQRYHFGRRQYHITKDSLVGEGERIVGGDQKVHFEGTIALSDIDAVISEDKDSMNIVFVLIVMCGVVAYLLHLAHSGIGV